MNKISVVLIYATLTMSGQLFSQAELDSVDLSTLTNIQFDEDELRINVDATKVEAASKTSENIGSAPGLMTVVTAQEIAGFGANNLTDVLNRVIGIYVAGSYYFPNNLPTIRGDLQTHTTSHVLILIDGRPSRESMYGGLDFPLLATFPLEAIERLELIRGPGSVLYGTNAFSGVINIITRHDKRKNTQASIKVGSFGTIGTTATTHTAGKDFVFNTSFQYFRQNGWDFNATDQNNVNKTQTYGQNNFGFSLSSSYKNLTIRTFYGNSDRDVMGDLPVWNSDGTFNGVNAYRGFFDVGYLFRISKAQHSTLNFTFNSFKQKSNRDGRPADYHSNDGLLEYTHFFKPAENLNIVAGALTTYITGEASSTNIATNLPYFPIRNYGEWRWAAYVQADYTLWSKLKLIGGGQLNKVPGNELDFVPRFGAIYNVTPELGLKGLYGQAFKSASANEKFSNVENTLYGNENLAPEKVSTYDLQLFYQRPSYQFTLSAFQSKIKNLVIRKRFEQLPGIPQQGSNPLANIYINEGRLDIQGFEAEAKILPTQEIQISASYAYQESENSEGEANTTTIPNHILKGGVYYSAIKGLKLGIFNSYFSRPGDVKNTQTELSPDRQRKEVNPIQSSFQIITFNINANITRILKVEDITDITLNLFIDNLLDENIYYPEFSRRTINTLPAYSGRAFYTTLTIKF